MKRLTENQKKLLSLFDDLKTIFNVNVNETESANVNENESVNVNESENESENENESVYENESVNENENESVNENENENENKSVDGQYYLEKINNNFKEINETKLFKDQMNIFKKIPDLGDYWDIKYYEDNKDINVRLFKLKIAHIFNDVDDNLSKEIFGFKSVELANKLINTASKKDNQMLIDHIKIKNGTISEQEYSKFVIQPANKRGDLADTVKVILDFNKTIQPYLT